MYTTPLPTNRFGTPEWISILLFLVLYTWGLDRFPLVAMDEPWLSLYAEQEFGSQTHTDLTSTIQYKLFFLHPLFVQAFQAIFGVSLAVARIPALLSCIGSLIALWKIAQFMNWTASTRHILYAGFLFSNSSIVMFHWVRPEAMVVLWLSWAMYFLLRAWQNNDQKYAFLTGFSLALGVITHPFAAVLVIGAAAAIVAAFERRWNMLTYFILGGIPVLLIMVGKAVIMDWEYVQHFLTDHLQDRITEAEDGNIFERTWFLFWHYSMGIKRAPILLAEMGVVILSLFFAVRNKPYRLFSVFGLVSLLTGLILINPFRRRYFVIIAMIALILIALWMEDRKSLSRWMQRAVLAAVAGFILNSAAGTGYFLWLNKNNTPFNQIETFWRQQFTDQNVLIVGPIQFWTAFHDKYFVTNVHDFPLRGSANMEALLKTGEPYYIFVAESLLQDVSPTTGEPSQYGVDPFYTTSAEYAEEHGVPVATQETTGYGKLTLYRVDRNAAH